MRNRNLCRLSRRVIVLLLCCSLVSGSVVNKCKITANATSIAATASACTLYEICLYVGSLVVTGLGVGYAYENRDELANIGKDFIDWLDIDDVSGWVLTKANTTGQSYVYGTEALQEVKDTTFEVIQGGGNMPENNEDNDGDGDVDAEDRTVELKNLGLWATSSFANLLCEQIQPILDKVQAGEETFIENTVLADKFFVSSFDGYELNNSGYYDYSMSIVSYEADDSIFMWKLIPEYKNYSNKLCMIYDSNTDLYRIYAYSNGLLLTDYSYTNLLGDVFADGVRTGTRVNKFEVGFGKRYLGNGEYSGTNYVDTNLPIFFSKETALFAIENNYYNDALKGGKVYQIADWLQENWKSSIEQLNTGIRSLNDNMLIVGEAANQALINQSNGLGYIEDLATRIATTAPLALPDVIADPVYYPDDSTVPKLAPADLPWNAPEVSPEPGENENPGSNVEPTPDVDSDIDISGYAIDLRKLFPFCIPFDFIALLRVLDAEPEAPRFEIPFVVPSVGIDEMYVIDLSMFDDVMEVIRLFELVGFVIGLMLLTGKVIKW